MAREPDPLAGMAQMRALAYERFCWRFFATYNPHGRSGSWAEAERDPQTRHAIAERLDAWHPLKRRRVPGIDCERCGCDLQVIPPAPAVPTYCVACARLLAANDM